MQVISDLVDFIVVDYVAIREPSQQRSALRQWDAA